MKRGTRHRKHPVAKPVHKHPPVTDRRIVWVSDEPLRRQAAGEYSKAMAKLEKGREELRQFEQQDQPAFQRWMAVTFGPLMTELRENAMLIAERLATIYEVEEEMMLSGHENPRRAYAAVMKRRKRAEQAFAQEYNEKPDADAELDEEFDDDFSAEVEISEEERHEMFEEFLLSEGIDPECLGRQQYARMFKSFETRVFGEPDEEKPIKAHRGEGAARDPEETRIKEVYRILVRRLHPDTRADGDAAVSAIWHDVQEAYQMGNLVRLEALLAVTEMEAASSDSGAAATLSQMRQAVAELRRAYQALRKGITEAMRDPAWGFARNPYRGQLEKQIRRDMEYDLNQQREMLETTRQTLEEWSRPAYTPASKPPGSRNRRGKAAPPKAVQPDLFDW
jgi:hypothetical protein